MHIGGPDGFRVGFDGIHAGGPKSERFPDAVARSHVSFPSVASAERCFLQGTLLSGVDFSE